MNELAPLIKDLTLMLGLASLISLLFQKIRQPVLLGYLIVGIIVGPYTPPPFVSDIQSIKILSNLGITFLMFSLGLDFSFRKLIRIGISASIMGIIKILLMISLGIFAGWLMGWSFYNCLFLGSAIAFSSSIVVIKIFEEFSIKTSRFSELIHGVLIVEDLLIILLIVALTSISTANSVISVDLITAAVKLTIIIGSWILIGYFFIPLLIRCIIPFINLENVTVISIALCLFLVSIAAYFHYSNALGAFIMGSILAETPLANHIEQIIRPIRDIFVAVFFISAGMLINPKLILDHWLIILFLFTVIIIGKLITTSISTFLTGQDIRTSIRSGLVLAQIGEFSFIIAGLGQTLHVTNDALYSIIVAVSVLTTFIAPYSIRYSRTLSKKFENSISPQIRYSLSNYSLWLQRIHINYKNWHYYHKAIVRFIANGIVVAIIFTLTNDFIYPKLTYLIQDNFAEIVSWLGMLILSLPFLWGMVFSFKFIPHLHHKTAFIALLSSWMVTIIEAVTLSVIYFPIRFMFIILTDTILLFFVFSYKKLGKYYLWLEQQLLMNVTFNDLAYERYAELAPWDTHLVEVHVINANNLTNRPLKDTQIRKCFGVNIIAIFRGTRTILTPRGDENILPQDKLIVSGSEEKIELFRNEIEKISFKHMTHDTTNLENCALKIITLTAGNPLIGQSIRDSKIRETFGGLVVGIERNMSRILNPDPATTLKLGDRIHITTTSRVD